MSAVTMAHNRKIGFIFEFLESSTGPISLSGLHYHRYWAEERDAGAFSSSIILDPYLGFGGDGVGRSNCIRDGPFANYTNPIGPGYEINDHCIDRQVTDDASIMSAPFAVETCMNQTQFTDFWPCIEAAPHTAGHGGIGAQVRGTAGTNVERTKLIRFVPSNR